VCRRLHHAPGVARGAHATALAGEGHKVVVSTIVGFISSFVFVMKAKSLLN
jgi:hypothetical protein